MNESIRQVAEHYLDGKELTEPLLNQIEVAVRAYDPCLVLRDACFGPDAAVCGVGGR
jgi:coenzyme F420-reducing hydrogenase alpha subunit